jgi:hypothetical protein
MAPGGLVKNVASTATSGLGGLGRPKCGGNRGRTGDLVVPAPRERSSPSVTLER